MNIIQSLLNIEEPKYYYVKLNKIKQFVGDTVDKYVNNYNELIDDISFAGEENKKTHYNYNFCDRPYVIHFIESGKNWLFVGIYKIDGVRFDEKLNYKKYILTEQTGYEKYKGRLILKHKRPSGSQVMRFKLEDYKQLSKFEIHKITENPVTILPYPGNPSRVSLTFDTLRTIINSEDASWKNQLSHMYAIYVITDMSNGKLYIGSATGTDGIWSRWGLYANTYHVGNKEFKLICEEYGTDYIQKNFRYSILEVFRHQMSGKSIQQYESEWKNKLMTRVPYGMNYN